MNWYTSCRYSWGPNHSLLSKSTLAHDVITDSREHSGPCHKFKLSGNSFLYNCGKENMCCATWRHAYPGTCHKSSLGGDSQVPTHLNFLPRSSYGKLSWSSIFFTVFHWFVWLAHVIMRFDLCPSSCCQTLYLACCCQGQSIMTGVYCTWVSITPLHSKCW